MSVAETSLMAYEEHIASGKVGAQAQSIINSMRTEQDYSRRELARLTGLELSSICGRVNELVAIGKLEECDKRRCAVTGKTIKPIKLAEAR